MRAGETDETDVIAAGVAPVRILSLPHDVRNPSHEDTLAVEAPLEVRIGGKAITVLMRTPGHDEELVTGFLFSEGIIADADDILGIEPPTSLGESEKNHVLDVRLSAARRPLNERYFFSNSSCGICGKQSLESIEVHGPVITSQISATCETLSALPDRLRKKQALFSLTGGVHASGLFTPDGELLAVREDVGRHNALDKLVGWALTEGRVPLSDLLLLVSGRLSYELVQKAIAAGIPLVAAVGAPSSLAVELAERFNITLIGFLRANGMNLYSCPSRVRA